MKHLDMNLARRPFTNDMPAWVLVGSLATLGLGLTVWNVSLFASVRTQVAEFSEERSELEARRRRAERQHRELLKDATHTMQQLGATRFAFANEIIHRWGFSWTGLFNAIEEVIPYGVRLRNIRPRFEEGVRLRIGGIATDNESFWSFQERLQASLAFGQVYPDLVSASDSRLSIGRGEQLFTLDMEYFPGAPPDLAEDRPELPADTGIAAVEMPSDTSAADGFTTIPPAPSEVPGPTDPAAERITAAATGDAAPALPPDAAPTAAAGGSGRPSQPADGSARGDRRTSRGRKRPTGQTAGLERRTPFPAGSPLAVVPQLDGNAGRPSQRSGGLDFQDYAMQPDGTLKNDAGETITIEELSNKAPGHIRPLRQGELPTGMDPENPDGEMDDSGTDADSSGTSSAEPGTSKKERGRKR